MNTNDALLVKMIEKDMLQKGIAEQQYHVVKDEIITSPKSIEVKTNEVVYVCYFFLRSSVQDSFSLSLSSAGSLVSYKPTTTVNATKMVGIDTQFTYESPVISAHWTRVEVTSTAPVDAVFFIRYLKLAFTAKA